MYYIAICDQIHVAAIGGRGGPWQVGMTYAVHRKEEFIERKP
jgi:hypothetical protein